MKNLSIFLLSIILYSCASSSSTIGSSSDNSVNPSESAVLWQQTAAEYNALCYQSYQIARKRVEDFNAGFSTMTSGKPKAIILDIDETVLNNSAYNGWLVLNNKKYGEESWEAWVKKEEATLIPGAKEFIDFAMNSGFTILFVTNRSKASYKSTFSNLLKYGIEATIENCYFKYDNDSDKSTRREDIKNNYEIFMFIGDNLADFEDVFEDKGLDIATRKSLLEQFKNEFGNRFIILPNVMYGDWENSLKKRNSKSIMNDSKGNLQYIKSY